MEWQHEKGGGEKEGWREEWRVTRNIRFRQ